MNGIFRLWRLFPILLVMLPASTRFVNAQDKAYAVDVSNVHGQLVGTGAVITGTATNILPWPVTDVKVVAIFDGTSEFGIANIKRLESGKSENFTIAQKGPLTASTFTTLVGSYSVESNDVSLLLSRYDHSVDDPALQAAIPQAFITMTDVARPDLLNCIDTNLRPTGPPTVDQEVHDLMCLEGIRRIGGMEGAQSTLKLLAWYEEQGATEMNEVRLSMLVDEYSPIKSFPLLQNLTLLDVDVQILAKMTLVDIGSPAVPALLYASQDSTPMARQTAQDSLILLNKTSIDSILSEDNPVILKQIIGYLQEFPRSDAVVPLLGVSHRIKDDLISAQIESCIFDYGDIAIQPLSDALLSPNLDTVKQAEFLLNRLAPGREKLLQSILATQGFHTNHTEAKELVNDLQLAADAHIHELVNIEFSRGWDAYQAGDCFSALMAFETMYAIRSPLPEYDEQVSQAYACQITALANVNQVDQAISLIQGGLVHMPGNQALRDQLVGFYQSQANTSFKAGDLEKAGDLWKQVLDIDSGNQLALQGIGRLNIRINQLYLVIGGLGMLILVALSISRFPRENENE